MTCRHRWRSSTKKKIVRIEREHNVKGKIIIFLISFQLFFQLLFRFCRFFTFWIESIIGCHSLLVVNYKSNKLCQLSGIWAFFHLFDDHLLFIQHFDKFFRPLECYKFQILRKGSCVHLWRIFRDPQFVCLLNRCFTPSAEMLKC